MKEVGGRDGGEQKKRRDCCLYAFSAASCVCLLPSFHLCLCSRRPLLFPIPCSSSSYSRCGDVVPPPPPPPRHLLCLGVEGGEGGGGGGKKKRGEGGGGGGGEGK